MSSQFQTVAQSNSSTGPVLQILESGGPATAFTFHPERRQNAWDAFVNAVPGCSSSSDSFACLREADVTSDVLIDAIIAKKDQIERENELKKRDSVLLSSTSTPVWAAQADQEEAREKARAASGSSWSCCST